MYSPPPQPVYYGDRYSGCMKIIIYLASFFIPLVGIIVAIIFMGRQDPESKRLGQTALILGIISIVLSCCGTVISIPTMLLPFLQDYGYY